MPIIIPVPASKKHLVSTQEDCLDIAQRIASIVSGSDCVNDDRNEPGTWCIDIINNDWWLKFLPPCDDIETWVLSIGYRHEKDLTKDKLNALGLIIKWFLGLEE